MICPVCTKVNGRECRLTVENWPIHLRSKKHTNCLDKTELPHEKDENELLVNGEAGKEKDCDGFYILK